MALIRRTLTETAYPPPIRKGKWDLSLLSSFYPEKVKETYKFWAEKEENVEIFEEPRYYVKDDIDELIQEFLTKNKITKKQLHTVEAGEMDSFSLTKNATIIYEDENE